MPPNECSSSIPRSGTALEISPIHSTECDCYASCECLLCKHMQSHAVIGLLQTATHVWFAAVALKRTLVLKTFKKQYSHFGSWC